MSETCASTSKELYGQQRRRCSQSLLLLLLFLLLTLPRPRWPVCLTRTIPWRNICERKSRKKKQITTEKGTNKTKRRLRTATERAHTSSRTHRGLSSLNSAATSPCPWPPPSLWLSQSAPKLPLGRKEGEGGVCQCVRVNAPVPTRPGGDRGERGRERREG